jgi:hypothetical protein
LIPKLHKVFGPDESFTSAEDLNNSKENQELCTLLKKQFGFAEMYINWGGQSLPNAFSLGRGIIKMLSGELPATRLKSSSGGYYDEGHNYLCYVEVEQTMVTELDLTPEETVAIILHEIGHNFQCTPVTNVFAIAGPIFEFAQTFTDHAKGVNGIHPLFSLIPIKMNPMQFAIYRLVNWVVMEFGSEFFKLFDKICNPIYKSIPVLGQIRSLIEQIKKILFKDIGDFIPVMIQPFLTLSALVKGGKLTPEAIALTFVTNQLGYAGEVFADSFATAYGYGPATISAHEKVQDKFLIKPSASLAKDNFLSLPNQFIYITWSLFLTLLDCHPMTQTRMKNQINKLQKELNSSDLPPKMKASCQRDLNNSLKIYNRFLTMDPQERYLNLIISFRQINETFFGGKIDLRNYLNYVLNLGKTDA